MDAAPSQSALQAPALKEPVIVPFGPRSAGNREQTWPVWAVTLQRCGELNSGFCF